VQFTPPRSEPDTIARHHSQGRRFHRPASPFLLHCHTSCWVIDVSHWVEPNVIRNNFIEILLEVTFRICGIITRTIRLFKAGRSTTMCQSKRNSSHQLQDKVPVKHRTAIVGWVGRPHITWDRVDRVGSVRCENLLDY
jgi:hypothetical protein